MGRHNGNGLGDGLQLERGGKVRTAIGLADRVEVDGTTYEDSEAAFEAYKRAEGDIDYVEEPDERRCEVVEGEYPLKLRRVLVWERPAQELDVDPEDAGKWVDEYAEVTDDGRVGFDPGPVERSVEVTVRGATLDDVEEALDGAVENGAQNGAADEGDGIEIVDAVPKPGNPFRRPPYRSREGLA